MKSLVTFNPYRMDNMTPYQMLECMEERFNVANGVLDKLREAGRMSGKQLDNAVAEILGASNFTIRPYLDALERMGYIRTEIIPEEYIKVEMEHSEAGEIYSTHDPNCVIFIPRNCYSRSRPYLIYNPTVSRSIRDEVYVQGDRMVQVRRKYYYWVG